MILELSRLKNILVANIGAQINMLSQNQQIIIRNLQAIQQTLQAVQQNQQII